jgi:hypothetical protein
MPDDLEKLLAEVKAEIEASDARGTPPLTSPVSGANQPATTNVVSATSERGSSLIDEMAAEYAARDREEIAQQQLEREARDREEREAVAREAYVRQQAEIARREMLLTRAKQWLASLDPHSTEGLWFEEFSIGFASPIDAAVEYLETVKPDAQR